MVDTHCHLDSEVFATDLDLVLSEAQAVGVDHFIIPGADPQDGSRAIELAQRYQNVFFASGVHPYHLDTFDLDSLFANQNHPKCVAIGECGLDYFRLPIEGIEEYKKRQRECFVMQIELAIKVDKPLILHVREASAEVFEILKQYPNARGVFHCFNADKILLELSDRFYYGIGGVLTFKNAKRLVEVLPLIPQDRILLETDAPYLTPHPFRGERNEPKYIPLIVSKMSEILGIPVEKIQKLCNQNTQELFNLFL
ncbi:TatD family hydrolase [Helicobacter kayseriensis]|uniref:TatD family hydrolase n=1 Tax=Helicobacter kayseriensis TaxID=2905877 RepID=UPI001E3B2701|nr:TatD family hydrolase [Helicobacter kayseriensis]MCE3046715.1 TatD family hydrolase [Helicobacter kayseriensis]MCE3047983.1 TatD family hydrolase [Helicobacter kayseriensis]